MMKEENHLQPFIDSKNYSGNAKIHMADKIMDDFNGGPRKICRITNKFNIFKIKWNRIILDEAHEKLKVIVALVEEENKNDQLDPT